MRPRLLDLMEELCRDAVQYPALAACAKDCLAMIRQRRANCRRAVLTAAGKPRGHKPREIPWETVERLRNRGKTWREIAERLEAAGTKICHSQLIRRFRRRFKDTIVRTVTRG